MADKINKNIEHLKNRVNASLEEYFKIKINEARKIDPVCLDIVKYLKDYTLRAGKRVRAILFILGYQAISGKINKQIIDAAISMEMIQSALLAHDDIMDQDELRRGGATIHKHFSVYKDIKSDWFGTSIAILAGNIAQTYAQENIINSKFDEKNKFSALGYFNQFLRKVNFGQALDVAISYQTKSSQKKVAKIHLYKTATYTAHMPLLCGAALAGASRKQIDLFINISNNLGLAFQIMDDIVGIYGFQSQTGKSNYSDLEENKKTYLIIYALNKASKKDKIFINKMLGNKHIKVSEFKKIKKILINCGSLQYSIKKAQNNINLAKKEIINSEFNNRAKNNMLFIADYIINKDKLDIK
jgi:geranylgeranyl diphosphate synthase type I